MATAVDVPKELPEDDPDDVLFNSLYGVRTIELNRPSKLNSLDGSMIRKILPRLLVRRISYCKLDPRPSFELTHSRNGKSRT